MEPPTFLQTVVGGIVATVVGGTIMLIIQKDLFGSVPPNRIPTEPVLGDSVALAPVKPIPEGAVETFIAPIGVTKMQIAQCVQRNSSEFVFGRDYSLEEAIGSFGEVLVNLHKRDQTLKTLLQGCSRPRTN
jgi:hypothetical protein